MSNQGWRSKRVGISAGRFTADAAAHIPWMRKKPRSGLRWRNAIPPESGFRAPIGTISSNTLEGAKEAARYFRSRHLPNFAP
jgi:hypothetical protein